MNWHKPDARRFLATLALLLARVLALLSLGYVACVWSVLAVRALIRFDLTGLENGYRQSVSPIPIDYRLTLLNCLGPVGWIAALGAFGLAFTMALTITRWRWALRVIVAVAPVALVMYLTACIWDIHPWVRVVCLRIEAAEALLAALAAVLCRPTWRLLLGIWTGENPFAPSSAPGEWPQPPEPTPALAPAAGQH